jgi:hypothetical protein
MQPITARRLQPPQIAKAQVARARRQLLDGIAAPLKRKQIA